MALSGTRTKLNRKIQKLIDLIGDDGEANLAQARTIRLLIESLVLLGRDDMMPTEHIPKGLDGLLDDDEESGMPEVAPTGGEGTNRANRDMEGEASLNAQKVRKRT